MPLRCYQQPGYCSLGVWRHLSNTETRDNHPDLANARLFCKYPRTTLPEAVNNQGKERRAMIIVTNSQYSQLLPKMGKRVTWGGVEHWRTRYPV